MENIKLQKIGRSRIKSSKDVWEKYLCPKCIQLLEEAVQIACGHRLCKGCAIESFDQEENPICPVKEDGDHNMIPEDVEDKSQKYFPDKFAQRDINKIEVICQFPGCGEVVTVKDLKKHSSECKYAGIFCEHCKQFIALNEWDIHKSNCPYMEKNCPICEIECTADNDERNRGDKMSDLAHKLEKYLKQCNAVKYKGSNLKEHLESDHADHITIIVTTLNLLKLEIAEVRSAKITEAIDNRYEKDGGPGNKLVRNQFNGGADKVETDGSADTVGLLKAQEEAIHILKATLDAMRKESIQTNKELNTSQNDLALALEEIKNLKSKVDFFEQKLATREQQLEEKDFRLSLLEAGNYDGTMIWRVGGFESRSKDARDARYTSIFSLPFYTSKYGYKMCLRLYPMGDGMGKNTHLSLFFVVMKSEYDSLLQWPFINKVTLTLINQTGGPDVTDTFKPDPKSSSFQRPKTEMNVASGCPRFVPLDDLHRNGFIKEDTIFIKVKVEQLPTRY